MGEACARRFSDPESSGPSRRRRPEWSQQIRTGRWARRCGVAARRGGGEAQHLPRLDRIILNFKPELQILVVWTFGAKEG